MKYKRYRPLSHLTSTFVVNRTEKSKLAWTGFWDLLSTCMARCLRNGSSPITVALVQVYIFIDV